MTEKYLPIPEDLCKLRFKSYGIRHFQKFATCTKHTVNAFLPTSRCQRLGDL